MFCKKCGNSLKDGAMFCTSCGQKVSGNVNAPKAPAPEQTVNNTAISKKTAPGAPAVKKSPAKPAPKEKSGKGAIITIIILSIVAVLIAAVIVFFAINGNPFVKDDDVSGDFDTEIVEEEEDTEEEDEKEKDKDKDEEEKDEPEIIEIEDTVDELIASYGLEDDVAVAVVDNKTGMEYLCNNSSKKYTAWGFYLPVYMALCDKYPDDYDDYKEDILSGDAGRCNTSANSAMDLFDGTEGISDYLSDEMGYKKTSYGRKFGDVNATTDNYTTAAEAVRMLREFNDDHNYEDLCYNESSYGVEAPSDADMYSQIGTENISEKDCLNVFSVVKGETSDYSIVILTENGASAEGIIDEILASVYDLMEGAEE